VLRILFPFLFLQLSVLLILIYIQEAIKMSPPEQCTSVYSREKKKKIKETFYDNFHQQTTVSMTIIFTRRKAYANLHL